jgi:hypothetical protein
LNNKTAEKIGKLGKIWEKYGRIWENMGEIWENMGETEINHFYPTYNIIHCISTNRSYIDLV